MPGGDEKADGAPNSDVASRAADDTSAADGASPTGDPGGELTPACGTYGAPGAGDPDPDENGIVGGSDDE